MLTHALNLTLDVLLGHGDFRLLHLQPLVVAERDLGALRELRRKDDILALFECNNINLGARDRLHILLRQSVLEGLLGNALKCLLQDRILADKILDDLTGCLALAETGNVHASGNALCSAVCCLFKLRLLNFNRQSDLAVFTMLCRNLHCMKQPPAFFLWKCAKCSFPIDRHAKSATSAIVLVSYHKNYKMTSRVISTALSCASAARRDPYGPRGFPRRCRRLRWIPSALPENPSACSRWSR